MIRVDLDWVPQGDPHAFDGVATIYGEVHAWLASFPGMEGVPRGIHVLTLDGPGGGWPQVAIYVAEQWVADALWELIEGMA